MTRTDLLALAARVETEEPSIALNVLVSVAVGNNHKHIDYLRSLDAAASLVPEGCAWSLSVNEFRAEVIIGHPYRFAEIGRGIAKKSAAAALTAAALRAKAQEASDE